MAHCAPIFENVDILSAWPNTASPCSPYIIRDQLPDECTDEPYIQNNAVDSRRTLMDSFNPVGTVPRLLELTLHQTI